MNPYFLLAICLIASYLIGSILFAVIITKIAIGKDIRKIGNTNPGSSNVMRSVGPVAGVLTALLDIAKALVPIIIARIYFFPLTAEFDWLALYLIGMAAILGHCRPFWMGFKKGGGGMGSAVGVTAFFVPVEFAVAILIGTFIAFTFMKNAEFKFGRWSMTFAAVLNPFVVWAASSALDIKLFWHFSIGGHGWGVIIGAFLLLVELFWLNSYELFHWLKDPKDKVNPERK
ncbi:MAG: glycerol-3-phosphate acyltransferase [Eubacteriales bacterium]